MIFSSKFNQIIKRKLKKIFFRWYKNRWISKNYIQMKEFEDSNFYDFFKTLELLEDGKSLSRFGDGEIELMFGRDIDFQKACSQLSVELEDILKNDNLNLIVGLPSIFIKPNDYEEKWWIKYWYYNWSDLYKKISFTMYGSSMITRPDFFIMYQEESVKAWKKIWNNKNVLFVTGNESKFNFNHNIFDNVRNSSILYSQPTNAYFDLDRLVEVINNKYEPKENLILIALGPAGTVLASRLSTLGYQALDIGHITNSYDEVFSAT